MKSRLKPIAVAVALTFAGGPALAADFYLAAKQYTKTLPDGSTVPMWGYVEDTGNGTVAHCYDLSTRLARRNCVNALPTPSVPGPRLTLAPNDKNLRVFLTNTLPEPTSIIIPGQEMPYSGPVSGPTWDDGSTGPRTTPTQRVRSFGMEAAPNGGRRSYVWNGLRGNPIDRPGTFIYHSGTHPQKQVYMGLAGLVTKDNAAGEAYPGVPYDNEVVLFYSDIDPDFNRAVVNGTLTTAIHRHPTWFLVNGEPYVQGMADISQGSNGPLVASTTTLLRFASMASDTHVQVLQGMDLTIHAEDGLQYTYQDSTGAPVAATPYKQYSVMLPPAKTKDVTVVAPVGGAKGRYAIYDGNGYMTNPSDPNDPTTGDTVGGMLRFLSFAPGPNQAPVAVDDAASVASGLTVSIPVVANDTDIEGDPLSVNTVVSTGTAGTVNCGQLSCTYDATGVAAGTVDTFTYTVTDGNSTSAPATVTVTVLANQPPVANADTYTYEIGRPTGNPPIDVLANDVDAEGAPLTIASFQATTTAGGSVACLLGTPGATCTYSPPTATFNGPDSFNYTVSDGVTTSAPATVNITVTQYNQYPTPANDVATTFLNQQVIIPVLANDTDPEGDTVTIFAHDTTTANGGTVGCATGIANGTCTYTPAPGFSGTDTFTYTVIDGQVDPLTGQFVIKTPAAGDVLPTATVTVLVNPSLAPKAYFSTLGAGSVPGVSGPFDDADIYSLDNNNVYVRFKDAVNDLGLPNDANIDALSINGPVIYASFAGATTTIPGVGAVQDEDVVAYDTLTGTWSLFFDGAYCGLDGGADATQDVDAISVVNGTLYFSTLKGGTNYPVGGVTGADDADVYVWNGSTVGTANCSRALRAAFGPGNIGLPGNADIDGLTVKNGVYYMSFNLNGGTNVPGLGLVQDEAIVSYDPATGTWSLYEANAAMTANGQDLDAIDIP